MQLEIIKNKVFYFKNALPNSNEIIKYISENQNAYVSDWKDWSNLSHIKDREMRNKVKQQMSYDKPYGFSKEIHGSKINDDSKLAQYIKQILQAIDNASYIYQEKQKVLNERKWKKDFSILKYHNADINKESAELASHLDHPDINFTQEHTILVYYNDDYKGAELTFDLLDVTLKPEAGSIIMFQSVDPDTLHSTSQLISGTKYITLQMWVDGPIKGFDR